MTVGIVGLGLIGGSAAKAYRAAEHTVYAQDRDSSLVDFAILDGTVNRALTKNTVTECQLLLICTYPDGVLEFLREWGKCIAKDTLVIDFAGVKGVICPEAFAIAEACGFTFVGGHPMAGSHRLGYAAARANLYVGAAMVAVPPRFDSIALFARVKEALAPLGFSKITFCTAEEHDAKIAYTSQLAHVVSSAYVKSEQSAHHRGFSAGSFRDMTRVAYLNEEMWSDLFLCNRAPLLAELDTLIASLTEYRNAIEDGDRDTLRRLLLDGKQKKIRADRPSQ